METGNKTDIRWMEIYSDKMTLKVVHENNFLNTSIWPFSMS